jgi:site-specific DNA-methyltransferase (adenine-specific)
MASLKERFKSVKQEWITPRELFSRLDGEFHFNVDLAADETNHKCDHYYSAKDNAMTKEWVGVCWLNPPYGDGASPLKNWVAKACRESEAGNTVVMLIPVRSNTNWWHLFCMKAAEVRFLKGRPRFGDAKHGLPHPLAVVVFRPHDGETKYSSYAC